MKAREEAEQAEDGDRRRTEADGRVRELERPPAGVPLRSLHPVVPVGVVEVAEVHPCRLLEEAPAGVVADAQAEQLLRARLDLRECLSDARQDAEREDGRPQVRGV